MLPLDIPAADLGGVSELAVANGVIAGVWAVVAGVTASGRVRRNPLLGIRTGATMASDAAWAAGQRAGVRWMIVSAAVCAVACVAGLACHAAGLVVPGLVAGWAGIVVMLVLIGPLVRTADAAAKQATLPGHHTDRAP